MQFNWGMGRRVVLATVFGGLALLALAGAVRPARAGLSVCRGDPLLVLIDGTQVQLTMSIARDPSAVEQITYIVHAPQGTAIRQVTYTGGALLGNETVAFYADQAARSFTTTTIVRMREPQDCASVVTATTRVALQGGAPSGSVSGQACTSLSITLHP